MDAGIHRLEADVHSGGDVPDAADDHRRRGQPPATTAMTSRTCGSQSLPERLIASPRTSFAGAAIG